MKGSLPTGFKFKHFVNNWSKSEFGIEQAGPSLVVRPPDSVCTTGSSFSPTHLKKQPNGPFPEARNLEPNLLSSLAQNPTAAESNLHQQKTPPSNQSSTCPPHAASCSGVVSSSLVGASRALSLKLRLNFTSLAAAGRVLASCARVICGVGLRDLGVVAWEADQMNKKEPAKPEPGSSTALQPRQAARAVVSGFLCCWWRVARNRLLVAEAARGIRQASPIVTEPDGLSFREPGTVCLWHQK